MSAALLDALVSVAAGAVLAVPALVIVIAGGTWTQRSDGTRVLESVPPVGLVLLAAALFTQLGVALWNRGVRQGRTGQSFGKRRVGLLLVDQRTDEPLGVGRGVLRWALGVLLALPCLLTYLWAFVDPRGRTWHDLLTGSVAVRS